MLRIAICDDEKLFRENIKKYVNINYTSPLYAINALLTSLYLALGTTSF